MPDTACAGDSIQALMTPVQANEDSRTGPAHHHPSGTLQGEAVGADQNAVSTRAAEVEAGVEFRNIPSGWWQPLCAQ